MQASLDSTNIDDEIFYLTKVRNWKNALPCSYCEKGQ